MTAKALIAGGAGVEEGAGGAESRRHFDFFH